MKPRPILVLLIATTVAGCAAPDRWWRGNTHTHTLWSDGDGAPEVAAAWYHDHGYHFLVLSDHDVLSKGEKWFPITENGRLTPARVEEITARFGTPDLRTDADGGRAMRLRTLDELRATFEEKGSFIFIQGEEITADYENIPVHVNGLNLEEVIPPLSGSSVRDVMQRNVDAVIEQGRRLDRPTLAHVNHPNFGWALTPEDIASIRGERFFEVYNGHRGVRNHGDTDHPDTETMWDIALTLRLTTLDLGLLFGMATDDAHNHHDEAGGGTSNPGRGWVMVRAESLDAGAIIDALHRGDFYASSGVVLDDVRHVGGTLAIDIRDEPGVIYTTRFIGTRRTRDGHGPAGVVLKEITGARPRYTMRGDELYVRATITSSREHPNPFAAGDREQAWVQPGAVY
jgi:hypothetical protein